MTPPTLPSRYCAWDGVREDGRSVARLLDPVWAARQQRRTAVASPETPLEDLRGERLSRAAYWEHRLSGARREGAHEVGCLALVVLVAWLEVMLVRRVFLQVYSYAVNHPALILAGLGLLAVGGIPVEARNRRRTRLLDALRHGLCPNCGYTLVATSAGVTENAALIPACPECGAPWPLLPPPIPDGARVGTS